MVVSNEWRFIFACVRRVFGRPNEDRMLADGSSPINWDLVVQLSVASGLQSLVFAGLPEPPAGPPLRQRAFLQAGYLASKARTENYVEPILREVLAVLDEDGIPAIPLKGAALAFTAYPEPCLRTMGDLDILVRPVNLQKARISIGRVGLVDGGQFDRTDSHQLPRSMLPNGRFGVELHQAIIAVNRPVRIDIAGFWRRAANESLFGAEAILPSPSDILIHVCIHMASHHGYRHYSIRGLVDILAVATRYEDEIDWSQLIDLAWQTEAVGAVYWPLWFARQWVGAPVPDDVLRRLDPRGFTRTLTESAIAAFCLDRSHAAEDSLRWALVASSVYPRWSVIAKAAATWSVFFPVPAGGSVSSPGHLQALGDPRRLGRAFTAVRRALAGNRSGIGERH